MTDSEEDLVFPIVTHNNRTCLSLVNNQGKVLPFQLQIFSASGTGKGLAEEFIISEWKKKTGGVVIILADPKNECEFSFVQFLPKEKYHLDLLRKWGIEPQKFKAKLYHPFSFHLPKHKIPPFTFYSISLKDLTEEQAGILSESDFQSESIKLLMRVAQDLKKNDGLFNYLHEIQSRVGGKKSNKKATADPDNFYLSVGGGTSKSVTEVANLLSPFKQNYFLRKDSCPYKLDWEKILLDPEPYHIFTSLWLKNEKLQSFCVLTLLQQLTKEAQRLTNEGKFKKPILLVIPEILKLAERNCQGYRFYLSLAISKSLATIRSMANGISSISDSQSWNSTADNIKDLATVTLFGSLSPKDQEVVCKAMNYKREVREKLMSMNKNSYFKYGREEFDPLTIGVSPHAHKEPHTNFIEEYSKDPELSKTMKRYDELVKYMKNEYSLEEKEIANKVERERQAELEEERVRAMEKEIKKTEGKAEAKKIEKLEKKSQDFDLEKMKRIYELKSQGLSNREISKTDGINLSHPMIPKWIKKYESILETKNSNPGVPKESIRHEGVMPEELDANFGTSSPEEVPIKEISAEELAEINKPDYQSRDVYNLQSDTENVKELIESNSSMGNFKPKKVKLIDTEFDYLQESKNFEEFEE